MASYQELLSKRPGDTKAPRALPAGTYTMVIERYTLGESRKKKTPQVEFEVRPVSYESDVNEAELEGIDWQKKSLRHTFYVTDSALYRLAKFCTTVLGGEAEGRPMNECLEHMKGRTYKAEVTQRPGDEDGQMFNDIGTTASDD